MNKQNKYHLIVSSSATKDFLNSSFLFSSYTKAIDNIELKYNPQTMDIPPNAPHLNL